MSKLLTVKELATYLAVPLSWVYERTRPGAKHRLPHVRVGKYIRFDLEKVLQSFPELKGGNNG